MMGSNRSEAVFSVAECQINQAIGETTMHVKRMPRRVLTIISCLFFSQSLSAASPDAAFRLQTGFIDYAFEQKAFTTLNESNLASSSLSKLKLEDTLPFIGTGFTFFVSDFYLDLYLQQSFSGSDSVVLTGNTVTPVGGGNFDYEPFRRPIDADWDRTEMSLTAGYSVTKNFKLFAGYRTSETNVEQEGTSTNLDDSTTQSFTDDIDYSQEGFFLGGSYAWSVNSDATSNWLKGALSMNAGLAFVDGEIKEKFRFAGSNTNTSKREGDTLGLVLGIAWNGYLGKMLDNDLFYTAGLNGYQYDFEADNPEQDADFSEQVMQLTVGLSMPFAF